MTAGPPRPPGPFGAGPGADIPPGPSRVGPPAPAGSPPARATVAPPGRGGAVRSAGQPVKPPLAPLLVSLACLLLTLLLSGYGWFLGSRALPLWAAVLCYLATPFGCGVALVWMRFADVRLRDNPWYDHFGGNGRLRLLSGMLALSFLVGAWAIYEIAAIVSEVVL